MRNLQAIIISLLLLIPFSCKEKKEPVWSDLPQVTLLEDLKNTQFATTLENPISENKNVIYAPAFLFAWDALKTELKDPINIIEPSSNDFKLLNASNSHKNSLNADEYDVNVEVEEGMVTAYAYFNKTLPFPEKLEKLEEPIIFNNTKVKAFGMEYFNYTSVEFTNVLYYKNDDNFVLKFSPKDKHHEIILVKGLDSVLTLSDALKKTNVLVSKGKEEQKNENTLWKYEITHDDMFAIPEIKFNIATRYKTIENQKFKAADKNYDIAIAYQRTGFILNENGAVVESDALAASLEMAMEEDTIKHPKKMIFDKIFYIIIKRIDQTNPYFVMKVDNTELMSTK